MCLTLAQVPMHKKNLLPYLTVPQDTIADPNAWDFFFLCTLVGRKITQDGQKGSYRPNYLFADL